MMRGDEFTGFRHPVESRDLVRLWIPAFGNDERRCFHRVRHPDGSRDLVKASIPASAGMTKIESSLVGHPDDSHHGGDECEVEISAPGFRPSRNDEESESAYCHPDESRDLI
jgi:hypothetical protein